MKMVNKFLIMSCLVLVFYLIPLVFYKNHTDSHKIDSKVIIIGASSGIGAALAKEFAQRNYTVGITARREQLLKNIVLEIPSKSYYLAFDITESDAPDKLKKLINDMGGVDIVVINAGNGNCDLEWSQQKEIIDVNVVGFAAMASVAMTQFIKQGSGHLVGISSIAAVRGMPDAFAYCASKAFISTYLQGLRERFVRMNQQIYVTDVKPGYVDSPMGQSSGFWRASAEKAAHQIVDAIEHKNKLVYITKRWRLIACLFKILPDQIFYRLI